MKKNSEQNLSEGMKSKEKKEGDLQSIKLVVELLEIEEYLHIEL